MKQEDGKLKPRLDYGARPYLKHKQRAQRNKTALLASAPCSSFLQWLSLLPAEVWTSYGSSEGQPDRESLCPHRKALCAPLPTTVSDKATLGRSLPGNKHSWENVGWPGAIPRRGASASSSSPLQKHNLNNRFHVAPRSGKLPAPKMRLSCCSQWVSVQWL